MSLNFGVFPSHSFTPVHRNMRKKCMVRLFARGPNGKGAGNLHDKPNHIRPRNRPIRPLFWDIYIFPPQPRSLSQLGFSALRSRAAARTLGSTEAEATARQPWLATCSSPPPPPLLSFNPRIESVSCSVCGHRTYTWVLWEVTFPSVLGLIPVPARDG